MTKYIAIDGMGGSGKSYISDLLATRLNAEVFHLDDYGDDFHPFIGLPKLLEIVKQSAAEIVIYEGVGVFDDKFNVLDPFKILVKSSDDIINERIYKRDILNPRYTKEEWMRIGKIWESAQNEYFNKSIDNKADLTIGNNGELDIDMIVSEIQKVL